MTPTLKQRSDRRAVSQSAIAREAGVARTTVSLALRGGDGLSPETVAKVMKAVMKRPPVTESAIAGLVNHADLDPAEAIADLGYRPLGVHAGFERCFPIARAGQSDG